MDEEPIIITLIKEDHKDGLHKELNKYCPICTEEQLVIEVEDFLGGPCG